MKKEQPNQPIRTFQVKVPDFLLPFLKIRFNKDQGNLEKLLQALESLKYLLVCLFGATIFASFFLNIEKYASINFAVLIYIYVISISLLQIMKFILGGERYFGKVAYDIALLSIPPVIILMLLLNSDGKINTFGRGGIWWISPITILSLVMLIYLHAMNFSSKKGERILEKVLIVGLIVGLFANVMSNLSSYFSGTLMTFGFESIILLMIPGFVVLFAKSGKYTKFLISMLFIASFFFLYEEFRNFDKLINTRDLVYTPLMTVLIINALFTVGLLARVYKLRERVKSVLSRFLGQLSSVPGENLEKNIIGLISRFFIYIYSLTYFSISFGILSFFVVKGYTWSFINSIFDSYVNFVRYSEVRDMILGSGLQANSNGLLTIIISYGFIATLIILGIVLFIIFSYIKTKGFAKNSHRILWLASIFFFILFLNPAITHIFIAAWIISLLLIDSRETESDEKIEVFRFKHPNSPVMRVFEGGRVFALVFVLVVGIILIYGLIDSVNRGVFV